MEVDMNVEQLAKEIDRSKAIDKTSVGLSVNRTVRDGVAHWGVYIGLADPGDMTILCSELDYREKPTPEIAASIIEWWDSEWDD